MAYRITKQNITRPCGQTRNLTNHYKHKSILSQHCTSTPILEASVDTNNNQISTKAKNLYIITIYTQILIFDCPRRSMLIRQKCQKALRVTALYFATYGLAAEILNALRHCMASDFKQYKQ